MTPTSGGGIDENVAEGRVFEEKERSLAEYLARQGNQVVKLPEPQEPKRRHADTLVNGVRVELKRPESTNPYRWAGTIRRSQRHGGQARFIILDFRGRQSTLVEVLTALAVMRQLNKEWKTEGRIDFVRIIGDTFDLTSYEGR